MPCPTRLQGVGQQGDEERTNTHVNTWTHRKSGVGRTWLSDGETAALW